MPNNYEQFIECNFRYMYCCETFKVEEIEENKFYEYCLKMPNSYEQLLNGKTTSSEPSQSFLKTKSIKIYNASSI